ncbi:hypothetical protein, partial [Xanthobacter versatilis]|uniref:hypothetical protein n=1 Tax=Xanthobacter autotrophicus (strain ATCC BAA-1158 / Py2) TaxID=78245 RepID=UPI003729B30F
RDLISTSEFAVDAAVGTIEAQAAHINRLEERCSVLTGQVEAGAAEIERMKKERDEARLQQKAWGDKWDHTLSRAEAAEARADALQAEVERLREIVASFVAMVEDSMSGTTHPEVGRFVPGVTDLELRPDGSLKLSDARAALQHQEPKP